MAFRFNRLNKDLAELPKAHSSHELADFEKFIFEGFAKLRLANARELSEIEEENYVRAKLDDLLSNLSDLLFQASLAITTTYFSHSYQQNQLINQNFSV